MSKGNQMKKGNNKLNTNSKKEVVSEVKVEKVDVPSKKVNRQAIGTLVIGVLALIILITGFIFNKGLGGSTKESKEILDNFYKYMKSEEAKVIYYGSANCSYCELETPIMEQIKEDYDMNYLYIDAAKLTSSEQEEIIEKLDIEGSTPTVAVVKDDQVVDVNVGYVGGGEMVNFLKENEVLSEDATYKPEENLTFINFEKYKELVGSDSDSIIVIGQTTCSHCIEVKPVLSHIAGNYDIEINYLNLTEMNSDDQTELIESLKNLGYSDADNLGTPLTLIVKDKKISSTIEGSNPPSYVIREFKKAGMITE